jgi:hypothetical protein
MDRSSSSPQREQWPDTILSGLMDRPNGEKEKLK